MKTTIAKSGAPAWARLTWHDAEAIYLEMPVVDSHPIIMKFPFTEGGLTKCLNMMKKVYDDAGPHRERDGWNLDHPIIKRPRLTSGKLAKPVLNARSKSVLQSVLKKLGMI